MSDKIELYMPCDYESDYERDRLDAMQAAREADEDQHRRQVTDSWQRIKRGEYTETDLAIIETELRAIL